MLLTYVWEVIASNLGWCAEYFEYLCDFPQSLQVIAPSGSSFPCHALISFHAEVQLTSK